MTNDKDSGGAFVTPAQAFREGVRWREQQDNNGIVSDQYLAAHNPYGEDERTVQVPVSLIEEADAVMREGTRHERYIMAARLAALLSRPTPTAEHDDECFAGEWNEAAGVTCVCTCGAEPLRIEDMAPGTTFTARRYGDLNYRWRKEPDGWYSRIVNGGRQVSPEPRIDPSTIRDVTPPTTEGTK